MGLFSKLKNKDATNGAAKSKKKASQTNGAIPAPPAKPLWDDAWTRKEVEPEEIQELLRACTHEMKSRALDLPFFLLPFRPASDPSAARTFIRNFFTLEKSAHLVGERLEQELMLTEPMVLSSVMKWCWSRLAGGVVTWEAYELFRVGEQDSDMARNAFATFIPLSVDSDARTKIIFDFFDLMAAVAAHGKTNGMGGRKLSRFAGWWAFEHADNKNGFDGGYKSWARAADATAHLFFAYLRSLSPDSVRGISGVSTLPLSLQTLLNETRYPPEQSAHRHTSKVVMVVDSISPTPFALLRRAKNFEYRDDDRVLQAFSNYDDPVQALSDECCRVLKSISSVNESNAATTKASTSLGDASWSRFEDVGFGAISEYDEDTPDSVLGHSRKPTETRTLRSTPHTKTTDLGRPTTPSWADFLSSGFADQPSSPNQRPLILPPDKILPPIDLDSRGKSSQSHVRKLQGEDLEPGELASINSLDLDDAFWWVWITSLAGEETLQRKAVFGRCALIETNLGGAWLVIEEMVKGAAPEPEVGAYIAEKKGRFTFGRRRNPSRTKSLGRKTQAPQLEPFSRTGQASPASKTSIGPDQHARIQAAAAALQEKQKQQNAGNTELSPRRARGGDGMSTKTNSVFTLQPVILSEAAPAMKWAKTYDKSALRAQYLGNEFAGRGSATNLADFDTVNANGSASPKPPAPIAKDTPPADYGFPEKNAKASDVPLPAETPGEKTQAPTVPPPPIPKAPLPVAQPGQVANHTTAQSEAAGVPLPEAGVEGEKLEHVSTAADQQPADNLEPASSPESKRVGKKLKKKEGRNFKGLFKKKTQATTPQAPKADPLAAAAARAALSPRPQKEGSNSITRRLSRMGRKDSPAAEAPPVPATEPGQENGALQPPEAPFKEGYDSQLSLSRVDSAEQRQADSEFPKFDQGPLTEQPAFAPEEDPSRDSTALTNESLTISRPSTAEPVGAHYDPPISKGGEYEPSLSSRATEEEIKQVPSEDRWAQIRKNAAERAGRGSEDQVTAGRKSADSAADGEESGEETIESRVARIKARVAELTGNMQSSEQPAKAS